MLNLLKFQRIIVVIQQLKRSFFIVTCEFCPPPWLPDASRRKREIDGWKGRNSWGSLLSPPPEITERERRPRLWPLCQLRGQWDVPVPELISRLNRGPIVIGYSARHRHVCLRKKKWKQRRRFEERELIDSNFQRIIETFFFRRSRARFLYCRWSGIKAPLKLISCNLYKYRTCGVNA